MNKEMIISSTPHETRVAILEDDQVVEVFIEREHSRGVVGNIYKGRVSKVLPGMQSAFVDLGLERDAFLYVSDVISPTAEALEEDEGPPACENGSRADDPSAVLAGTVPAETLTGLPAGDAPTDPVPNGAPPPQVQGRPLDQAQGRPFDQAQGRPFDQAQGRPFDQAQGRR